MSAYPDVIARLAEQLLDVPADRGYVELVSRIEPADVAALLRARPELIEATLARSDARGAAHRLLTSGADERRASLGFWIETCLAVACTEQVWPDVREAIATRQREAIATRQREAIATRQRDARAGFLSESAA